MIPLASFLVPFVAAFGGDVSVFPVRDVPDGPLLLATQPDESTGRRREALFVIDPTGVRPPARALVTDGNHTVRARVGRGVLLVAVHGPTRLFRLDLERGEARSLFGDAIADLVSLDGTRVFLVESLARHDIGYRLAESTESKKGGAVAIESAPRPAERLLVVDDAASPEAAARPLAGASPFVAILAETRDLFFVVREEPIALVAIPKDGSGERVIATLPDDLVPTLMTADVSPSGRLVGVGAADRSDFFGHRHLFVADVEKGGIVFEKRRIPVAVSKFSSQSPSLVFTWLDDERLRYSESRSTAIEPDAAWVDIRIPSGEVLATTPRGPVGLWHDKPLRDGEAAAAPVESDRRSEGLFDLEPGRLFYRGEKSPLLDTVDARGQMTWAEISVSRDGRYAAFRDQNGAVIADGESKSTRVALPGWCYALHWR